MAKNLNLATIFNTKIKKISSELLKSGILKNNPVNWAILISGEGGTQLERLLIIFYKIVWQTRNKITQFLTIRCCFLIKIFFFLQSHFRTIFTSFLINL